MSIQIDLLKDSSFNQGMVALAEAIAAQSSHSHGNKPTLDATTASFTTDLKAKLDGIEEGAQVNVQPNWAETTESDPAFIKNKPTAMPASDVFEWAKAAVKPSYTYTEVGAEQAGAVAAHNESGTSHSDMRTAIEGLTSRLNALLDSDDTTLDQLSEIVAYIKNNKSLIDGITSSKVSVSDIIDNLVSTDSDKPLSANQGKTLADLITALTATVNGINNVSISVNAAGDTLVVTTTK